MQIAGGADLVKADPAHKNLEIIQPGGYVLVGLALDEVELVLRVGDALLIEAELVEAEA